ncbi:MAG: nucleotidyltransferase family protein [Terriglobia bacterium]
MKVNALVLGGGESGSELAEKGIKYKGLLEFDGRPMLSYVLEAVRRAPSVEQIVLVGPQAVLDHDWGEDIVTELGTGTISQNINAGVSVLDGETPIISLSADIPLVTREAVEDFVGRCEQLDGNIYYPLIPRNDVEREFPATRRTYIHLKEGQFTGGNLAVFEPAVFLKNKDFAEELYRLRKNPVALARLLGLKYILKFLIRRLSLNEVEKIVSKLLRANGRAVVTPHATIGFDVDKDQDIQLMRRYAKSSV